MTFFLLLDTKDGILNDVLVALFHAVTWKIFKLHKVHKSTMNVSKRPVFQMLLCHMIALCDEQTKIH